MTLRLILIALFCWTFSCLYAQTKEKSVIAETIDRGDYIYIPKSALTDKIEAIHYQDKIKRKVHRSKQPIELYWHSTCNDGSYILTITPEQIFFSSGHDNPNPNFLFWVIEINASQFVQIKKGLQKKPPQGFRDCLTHSKELKDAGLFHDESRTEYYDEKFKDNFPIPVEWTDAIMKQHELYCKKQIKSQLNRYLAILNLHIIDPKNKIVLPAVKMKPKYFSFFKPELIDWLPVKFRATEKKKK